MGNGFEFVIHAFYARCKRFTISPEQGIILSLERLTVCKFRCTTGRLIQHVWVLEFFYGYRIGEYRMTAPFPFQNTILSIQIIDKAKLQTSIV